MGNREKALYLVLRALGVDAARLRDFDGRRIAQKTVYLLQEGPHEWDFGYQYNLYLRGPYSPALADTGYRLLESVTVAEAADLSLKDECIVDIERTSRAFTPPGGELNADLLEVAATVAFLCKYTYGYLPTREEKLASAKAWLSKNKPSLASRFDEAVAGLEKLGMAV